jgi:hypothetical protein
MNAYDKAWWAAVVVTLATGALRLYFAWALGMILMLSFAWLSYRHDLARIHEAVEEARRKEQEANNTPDKDDSHD